MFIGSAYHGGSWTYEFTISIRSKGHACAAEGENINLFYAVGKLVADG